jgi:thioredoxin reductase (NADPH)
MKTTQVENHPGLPDGIMRPDLNTRMQEQAEHFGAQPVYDNVTDLDLTGPVTTVTVDGAITPRSTKPPS